MKKLLFCFVLMTLCAGHIFGQNNGALLPDVMPVYPLANGSGPLANGFLCTTTSGTNNPLATYRDAALTTANQNPVRLNSAGRPVNGSTEVSVFMQSAAYRITVYAAGTGNTCNGVTVGAQIRQVDNVYDYGQFVANIGSGSANYLAKWSTSTKLTNSQTTDDGLSITTLPSDGRADTVSWAQSLWRIARLQNSASNQFVANIQAADTINSGAGTSYEKSGLLIETITADPSGATQRDMVGLDTRCQIWSTITTGRCWGGISIATVTSGGDGYAVAHEFAIDNAGSNQPTKDTTTGKYVIHTVAGQSAGYTSAVTAGIYLDTNYGKMYNGIIAKGDSFADLTVNSALMRLYKSSANTDLFRIKPSGQTIIGDLAYNSSTGDYNSTIYGALTVREGFTVASAINTSKNITAIFADAAVSRMRIGSTHYDTPNSSWPLDIEVGGQNPAGLTPLLEFALAGGVHFKYNAAAEAACVAGEAVLRNNAGILELCNNGTGFNVIAAAGTSGITGTGTATYIPVWSAATVLTNSGLLEYTSGGSSSLIYGGTSTNAPTQTSFEALKSSTTGGYILSRNDVVGATSYAGLAAISGGLTSTLSVILGVTSSSFTPVAPLSASQAFLTTGAGIAGGFTLYTQAGTASFSINGATVQYKMTTDGALEFTAASTASCGAAGTARLRNNAGTLQVCNGSGAWQNLPGAGGAGVTGSGTQNYVPTWAAGGVSIQNSGGPLVEDTTGITCLIYGSTVCDDSAQMKFEAIGASTTGGGLIVRNSNTSSTTGYAALGARSGANGSNIDISVGVTNASFTTAPLAATEGFIKTGSAAANGLGIQTLAGAINFIVNGSAVNAKLTSDNAFELSTTSAAAQATGAAVRLRSLAGVLQVSEGGGAGTWTNLVGGGGISGSGTTNLVPKFSAATTLANSQIFDDGTSTSVGTQAATDSTATIRFEVEKDQNNTSAILMRNNNNGGANIAAVSSVAARMGGASLDVAITATSSTYSGSPAASAGMLYSGVDATSGLYIKSGAGNIHFQAASGSDNCTLTSAGALTCTSFVGIGAGLTSLNAASLAGIVPVANGGTGNSSQTSTGIVYAASASSLTTNGNLTYSGSNVNLTAGNFNLVTASQGVTFANGVSSISGDLTRIDLYPGGVNKFRVDGGATNGTCIFIGGSLQRLVLSGSAVQVSGPC